jgi:hypothetical protein
VALAFLILVFLFVIALIVVFIFPPARWAAFFGNRDKKQ